jgi:hypothetical protein
MIDKIRQLQEEYDILKQEVGDIQEVLAYLIELNDKRHEAFAYTNKMPAEQNFEFKGLVDGKQVSVMLEASVIERYLSKDPKVHDLRVIKGKITKINNLLEGK